MNTHKQMKNIVSHIKDFFTKPPAPVSENERIHMESVSIYHTLLKSKSDADEQLEEQAILDLDLNDVFYCIDNTASAIGKQYLYHQLLAQPVNTETIEKSVKSLNHTPDIRKKIQELFSKIKDTSFCYLPQLFLGNNTLTHPNKISYSIFALLALCTLIASFFNSKFMFVFGPVLVLNFYLHYRNKRNVILYTDTFLQLKKLYGTTQKLGTLQLEFLDRQQLAQDLAPLSKIKKRLGFLSLGNRIETNELLVFFWYFSELIKAGFLIDVLVMQGVLTIIEQNRSAIRNLYEAIGKIDLYLSVAALREKLPYFCRPDFTANPKNVHCEDVSHPLIKNCVPNSLELANESLLITGSNMSGKTTFLRTIAINNLLGRALNTCFARRFEIPYLQTYTSIRLTDDLANSRSYFLEEVCLMKSLVEKAEHEESCLFIIDEMFKGTNTRERIACVQAILHFLNRKDHLVLFSTHDLELIDLLKNGFKISYFSEIVEDEQLSFDYRLKIGSNYAANAVKILELNNYPSDIIQQAYQNLQNED